MKRDPDKPVVAVFPSFRTCHTLLRDTLLTGVRLFNIAEAVVEAPVPGVRCVRVLFEDEYHHYVDTCEKTGEDLYPYADSFLVFSIKRYEPPAPLWGVVPAGVVRNQTKPVTHLVLPAKVLVGMGLRYVDPADKPVVQS